MDEDNATLKNPEHNGDSVTVDSVTDCSVFARVNKLTIQDEATGSADAWRDASQFFFLHVICDNMWIRM